MEYENTQRGGIQYVLLAAAAVEMVGAWLVRDEPTVSLLLAGITALFVLLAGMFATLTVRDEGDRLAVRFGPLPVFSKTFRYDQISSVQRDRTRLIDGWGIHWIPGRGWTYNLWGFDCVKLTVAGRVIRIGTNDAERLAAFLAGKITPQASVA